MGEDNEWDEKKKKKNTLVKIRRLRKNAAVLLPVVAKLKISCILRRRFSIFPLLPRPRWKTNQ